MLHFSKLGYIIKTQEIVEVLNSNEKGLAGTNPFSRFLKETIEVLKDYFESLSLVILSIKVSITTKIIRYSVPDPPTRLQSPQDALIAYP